MWLQNFQVLKLRKLSYLLSGPNLEPNLLKDKDENLENPAVERVILKWVHANIFEELNYISYRNTVQSFEVSKSHPVANLLYIRMSTLTCNVHDTELAGR
jgi:hypothetical protein